ncbi:hypothetical protein A2U01_0085628, partial [Trifolium medium]|nr:hypothetical protein [Trifolium medium]
IAEEKMQENRVTLRVAQHSLARCANTRNKNRTTGNTLRVAQIAES